MKLRNQKSLLTKRSEGTAVHSVGSRVTQKIYIALVLGLLLFVVYIAASRFIYMEERGLVETERTKISSARGGRISNILVSQGQRVKQHDLLASIQAGGADCVKRPNSQIINLTLELQKNKGKRDLLRQRLAERDKLVSQKTLRRALEVDYGEVNRERKILREIEDIRLEMKLLETEIKQQNSMLDSLRGDAYNRNECFDEEIRAPEDGVIHALNHDVYEVVGRGEPILSFVAENAVVRVEAYVDDDELEVVEPGKSAVVILPNEHEIDAVIESVRSSAAVRADREWDHYTPVKTKLLVHFVPATVTDAVLWKQYDRMNVKVRVAR